VVSPARATSPRRTPLQRRSIETVDALLEAAAQVFERHGYAAGTTNRIAERAGVSIGSLYQYFPNKDAVLVALTERHLEEGTTVLTPLLGELVTSAPPIAEGTERVMDALVELHRHRPRLHRVLFEEAPRPAPLRQALTQASDAAADAIAAYLRQRPEVTVPDVHIAAQLVVGVAESTTHGLVIHPRKGVAPAAYVEAAVAMLTRYLTG
jgi:AcrR family transcriptional regulator